MERPCLKPASKTVVTLWQTSHLEKLPAGREQKPEDWGCTYTAIYEQAFDRRLNINLILDSRKPQSQPTKRIWSLWQYLWKGESVLPGTTIHLIINHLEKMKISRFLAGTFFSFHKAKFYQSWEKRIKNRSTRSS